MAPPRTPRPTRDAMIAALREVFTRRGGPVSRPEFQRESGFNDRHYAPVFGGYNGLVAAAGFTPHTDNRRHTEDELLGALRDAWLQAGGPVSQRTFARTGAIGLACYKRRWTTWTSTLAAFREWLKTHQPDFPHLPALVKLQHDESGRAARRTAPDGRHCGALLNFRGCLHAPTNEQGVVLLFGMVATDCGFLIETVSQRFPDCEAKRLVDGLWQRLRIEFELRSRNFALHGHDETACEMIVCWEHDWPDCPLEVLELKSEIETLRGVPQPRLSSRT